MRKSLAIITITLFAFACAFANCVQEAAVVPSPSPTREPVPAAALSFDEKMGLYNIAAADPYVQERILKVGWRNVEQAGDRYQTSIQYSPGDVAYGLFTESGPGLNRTRTLPAVEIIAGNASEAGINVIAYVEPGPKRVAYVGFVPRQGIPASDSAFAAVPGGVDEYRAGADLHRRYDNVTIVDTGYVRGMSLPQAEIGRVTQIALDNASLQQALRGHQARVDNVSVYSYEAGYPGRYILAYPMVVIDAVDGGTVYETLGVLVDGLSGRVVSIRHGEKSPY
jgi:hypothetical protein